MANLEAMDRIEAEAKARDELNRHAEEVMANSRPTPTQREADLIKAGVLHPDDKEDPQNPDMMPLHEQRRRIAEAGNPAPYRTRDMAAPRQAAREPVAQSQTQAAAPSAPAPASQSVSRPGAARAPYSPSAASASRSSEKKDEDKA